MWELPSTTLLRTYGSFLWSQSVLSLKLIVGFGYILILGYFSLSNNVDCSFDWQLWVLKSGFHVGELETEVFFVIFFSLLGLVISFLGNQLIH